MEEKRSSYKNGTLGFFFSTVFDRELSSMKGLKIVSYKESYEVDNPNNLFFTVGTRKKQR